MMFVLKRYSWDYRSHMTGATMGHHACLSDTVSTLLLFFSLTLEMRHIHISASGEQVLHSRYLVIIIDTHCRLLKTDYYSF